MAFNGYTTKPVSEFSEYQKKIESIDNVILCVAEAENMLNQIGASLITDLAIIEPNKKRRPKRTKSPWAGRINAFG